MHSLVKLAKETVEEYSRAKCTPSAPEDIPAEFKSTRAGVFVCLKKNGELRGCIGTIAPVTDCVASEVIRNSVSASTEDPRFPAVVEEELPEIEYSVDVLGEPEPVSDVGELDPLRYGVIVSKGFMRGLLLPDLEGVDTVQEQLRIACMKAGINPDDPNITIERFEVKRYQ